MKLIKEQVDLLYEEYERLIIEKEKYLQTKGYTYGLALIDQKTNPEKSPIEYLQQMQKRLDIIKHLLNNSIIVKNPNSTQIEVGTSATIFTKFSDDDYELLKVTFIEKKVSTESSNKFISLDSAFGRAAYHKELGSTFCYTLADGRKIRAQILGMEFEHEGIGKTYKKAQVLK